MHDFNNLGRWGPGPSQLRGCAISASAKGTTLRRASCFIYHSISVLKFVVIFFKTRGLNFNTEACKLCSWSCLKHLASKWQDGVQNPVVCSPSPCL